MAEENGEGEKNMSNVEKPAENTSAGNDKLGTPQESKGNAVTPESEKPGTDNLTQVEPGGGTVTPPEPTQGTTSALNLKDVSKQRREESTRRLREAQEKLKQEGFASQPKETVTEKEKTAKPKEEEKTPLTPTADEIGEAVAEALKKQRESEKEVKGTGLDWRRAVEILLAAGAVIDEVHEYKEHIDNEGKTPGLADFVRWKRTKEGKGGGVVKQEEVKKEEAKEKELRPPSPDEEGKPESKYSGISYVELRSKLKWEKDPVEVEKLREEKFKRAVEADDKKFFDLSQQNLKKLITETLTANDFDTFDESLIYLADNAENNAKGMDNGAYEKDARLKGVILDVVQGEIDAVRLDVYLGMTDAELSARKLNREKIQKERDDLDKTRLGWVTIREPAAHLQAEPTDELLDEFARHNIPGAEARLRRRQLEKQAREEEEEKRKDEQPKTTGLPIDQEGVMSVREVQKMPPEEQYIDFITKERWSDEHFDPEYEENTYYMGLRGEERENFRRRVKLHFAAWTKKRNSWSFKDMTENGPMRDLSTEDIEGLYKIPGVAEVLKKYVDFVDNDTKLPMKFINTATNKEDERSLRRCTNRYMIKVFRENITEGLKKEFLDKSIAGDISKENAEANAAILAEDAEQIGFNLAIVSNLFESIDAKWEGVNIKTGIKETLQGDFERKNYREIRRTRGFKIFQGSTDIMNKPIRTAFNPLDALIEMAVKPEEKETEAGVFTKWASNQLREQLRRAGYQGSYEDFIDNDWGGFKEVVIIDDEDKENYWKVQKIGEGEYKLFAPECYPLRQIGSYWEDATAIDPSTISKENLRGDKKTFLQFIREGKEIPFDYAYKAPGFSGYMVDSRYWSEVWDLYNSLGKEFNYIDILKTIGNVGEKENENIKRWLFYANKGLDSKNRIPTIRMTFQQRYSMEGSRLYEDYLSEDDLYFPWNRKAESRKQKYQRKGFLPALKDFIVDGIKGPR